jgi:hypothetical protein
VIDNHGGTAADHEAARQAGRWLDEVADGDVLVVNGQPFVLTVGPLGHLALDLAVPDTMTRTLTCYVCDAEVPWEQHHITAAAITALVEEAEINDPRPAQVTDEQLGLVHCSGPASSFDDDGLVVVCAADYERAYAAVYFPRKES